MTVESRLGVRLARSDQARALAGAGAHVVMAARNQAKAADAHADLCLGRLHVVPTRPDVAGIDEDRASDGTGDRTIYFDLLPLNLGTISGMKFMVRLFTVPGQVYYSETRKLVLKGADGVVFVADSQAARIESNKAAWRNLKAKKPEVQLIGKSWWKPGEPDLIAYLTSIEAAKPDAVIMHPGPMNRGVEISPDVADGPRSVILDQVTNGVAVRMALLYLVTGGARVADSD